MDVATLQEIQDSFASVANVRATIADADGTILTQPQPTREFVARQNAIAEAEDVLPGPQKEGREYVAPISVHGQRLGTIRMTLAPGGVPVDDATIAKLVDRFGLDTKQTKTLLRSVTGNSKARAAAVQFVYMVANAIARLCFQEFQLRQRVNELTTLYNVSMLLAEPRDLRKLLDRTVQAVCEVMDLKAASVRLIDDDRDELVVKAVHNLSPAYLSKGPIRQAMVEIDRIASAEGGYEYVRDMTSDPRVQYPDEARREGVTSSVSIAMRYKGEPVGVLRMYTAEAREFLPMELELLKALAAQAAAAIENTRLVEEAHQKELIETQIKLAADVQQRMLPAKAPIIAGVDLAHVYVPCFELAGDFFDFIELPDDNVGLVVADVSGKGLPASLIMASVRAALRAQVDNVYYLYEVLRRMNVMLWRDTKPNEFVTLFYGVLDARAKRFTYCNAGHPPPLLRRAGVTTELASDSMVLGINPNEQYVQNVLELRSGDTLLLYTDGLPDAMNFDHESFGKERVFSSFANAADTATTARETVDSILWDIRRFRGLAERSDDLTAIVLRVK